MLKREKRYRRHKRVRSKIFGISKIPRLCVFRSTKHIYTQLIDDEKGQTLAVASDLELKGKKQKSKGKRLRPTRRPLTHPPSLNMKRTGKVAIAYEVGKLIAEKALEKKIEKVVFDRGGYQYHGRVKALAEGARARGLKF